MRTVWLGLVLLLASAASGALVPVAWAQTDASSDTEARRRFDEGAELFAAGSFAEAANAFRRAYLLSPRYALLYNIGQAELRAGRDAQALEAFEGFLRQSPADDGRRGEVEERVRVLRSLGVAASTGTVMASSGASAATDSVGAAETSYASAPARDAMAPAGDATAPAADATAPAADATAPPPARVTADAGSSDVGPAPWIVAGIGGALAVAGGVLMGVGAADAASVTGAAPGTRWADLEGAAGRANGEWGAGLVLLGVGVAALGAGVVWGAVGGGGGESASARVGFGPGSVSVSGTF